MPAYPELTPVELTQLYLKRSEKFGQRLNAYARLTPEIALAQAQAQRSFGDKTDGRLPTTFFGMPPEVVGPLLGVQQNLPPAATTPAIPAR